MGANCYVGCAALYLVSYIYICPSCTWLDLQISCEVWSHCEISWFTTISSISRTRMHTQLGPYHDLHHLACSPLTLLPYTYETGKSPFGKSLQLCQTTSKYKSTTQITNNFAANHKICVAAWLYNMGNLGINYLPLPSPSLSYWLMTQSLHANQYYFPMSRIHSCHL